MDRELPYEELVERDLTSMPIADALASLAQLIDRAADRGDESGLQHAVAAGESIRPKLDDAAHRTTLHYYLANAWAGLRHIRRLTDAARWEWEQPEAENEIVHLRRAVQAGRLGHVASRRHMCPMLTNLGNLMNTVGRFVEAIAYWNEALSIDPAFGMARGNRGLAFSYYAQSLCDQPDAASLFRGALLDLREALTQRLESDARGGFTALRDRIESALKPDFVAEAARAEEPTKDAEAPEVKYRRWCLTERLFLTPLNDLGESWSAACDPLTLPGIVVPLREGPKYPSFFNQMKQEFVSARYLYYEAETSEGVHFSDRGVLLLNTLDYPSYSLATEKLKCAFRMAYALLDKIAYLLNDYLALQIPDHLVSFRSLWYEKRDRRRPLRAEFRQRENWPLRGLFWLSKDLSENEPGFRDALEPDARDVALVRNHLEHKHLRLHDDLWSGRDDASDKPMSFLVDPLAYSMYRSDFAAKALRLLRTARAALIYLSLAVWREETSREKVSDPGKLIMPSPLDVWEDDWKR